jgi:hypothetical protein
VPAAPTAIDCGSRALRTEEGGALVVAHPVREDGHAIDDGTRVNWPAGSEQRRSLQGICTPRPSALLPPAARVRAAGRNGTPFVMGHYGGVLAADGY